MSGCCSPGIQYGVWKRAPWTVVDTGGHQAPGLNMEGIFIARQIRFITPGRGGGLILPTCFLVLVELGPGWHSTLAVCGPAGQRSRGPRLRRRGDLVPLSLSNTLNIHVRRYLVIISLVSNIFSVCITPP